MIQSVQCSLFHEQQQKSGEMVDVYTQDLTRPLHEAYPRSHQETSQSDEMGHSLLVNQFTAGLLPHLIEKFVGEEGTFNQLLIKARFKETKEMGGLKEEKGNA